MGYQAEEDAGDIAHSEFNVNRSPEDSYFNSKGLTPKDRWASFQLNIVHLGTSWCMLSFSQLVWELLSHGISSLRLLM